MKDFQTTDMLLKDQKKKKKDDGKGQKPKFCTWVLMDSNDSI